MSGAKEEKTIGAPLVISGDEVSDWDRAASLEWIATNGIGGFASGTLAGASTRRYHGFLIAALQPPVGRTMLVARLEESVIVDGDNFELFTNEWWDGTISPDRDHRLLEFWLEDGIPVFAYDVGGRRLEKRVWMEEGENVTWAQYSWPGGAPPATLCIRIFLAHRDFHSQQRGSPNWLWRTDSLGDGALFSLGENPIRTVVRVSTLQRYQPVNQWYWGFLHRVERERGLDDIEDLWAPGVLEIPLHPGTAVGLLASVAASPGPGEPDAAVSRTPAEHEQALERERARRRALFQNARITPNDAEETALLIASDLFMARRPVGGDPAPASPNTVIAGYHWFSDWGRDTMISLPGLIAGAGRLAQARQILLAYASFISEGMLPNQFPDSGSAPEYNTVDATLWYFQAIHRYLAESNDREAVRLLYPRLADIIDWHIRGTRHSIGMDPEDGLLFAGGPGTQLTWMDAKVGDWVVTPRVGKPVEICALWYNALELMARWAGDLGFEPAHYHAMAERAKASFQEKFPCDHGAYLFDVVDGPDGPDASFRPNQLLALSLPFPLLSRERALPVVEACRDRLLTPRGLRSLDPADSRYVGTYGGDSTRRDGSYHQGTVWGWLIGPYVDAVLYATGDRLAAHQALAPLLLAVREGGIGAISEIFDGDPPHHPRGCIAQAWSVAETLRCLARLR